MDPSARSCSKFTVRQCTNGFCEFGQPRDQDSLKQFIQRSTQIQWLLSARKPPNLASSPSHWFFFLSWLAFIKLNYWTKRVVSTRLILNCPEQLPTHNGRPAWVKTGHTICGLAWILGLIGPNNRVFRITKECRAQWNGASPLGLVRHHRAGVLQAVLVKIVTEILF